MKNLNPEVYKSIFAEYSLSNEEMICVRGGAADEDPTVKVNIPPIII